MELCLISTMNDKFKYVHFTGTDHLPRKAEGNLFMFLMCECGGGGSSGKIVFAILESTMLFSSDSLAFSCSVIFCKILYLQNI